MNLDMTRVIFLLGFLASSLCGNWGYSTEIYVSPDGDDSCSGKAGAPVATLETACRMAREYRKAGEKKNTVILKTGAYYFPSTLVLTQEDSCLTIKSQEPQKAVISGAVPLHLTWRPFKNGLMQAEVPVSVLTGKSRSMDGLLVDGRLKRMARYPNANPEERIFEGYAADALSSDRSARWVQPEGGLLHAMHGSMWGSLHYRMTGRKANGEVGLAGGWQNNITSRPHPQYRFVENIFEELDEPGEWYFDDRTSVLYYYPESGEDMSRVVVESVSLPSLIEYKGTSAAPVKEVKLEGLVFTGTRRTFMETREALLSSDWMIYRGGAVFMEGVVGGEIEDCDFFQLGGNAVFVSGYNREVEIEKCYIHEVGASGVSFVGCQKAYRGPAGYESPKKTAWKDMDKVPGPQSEDYPAKCTVEDCLITRTGRIEKQSAPVEIAMARDITVRSCSLYDVPRAGINIGDGCWGGHLIEFCDVFDTVRETSDHGSFNSWGRDRFWMAPGLNMNDTARWKAQKGFPLLDAVKPNIIRNSRWRCDHGWDIDLDDGSGNYEIYNNLLLSRGLKLREGFFRKAYNNIIVNSSLHPHVWYVTSGDVVKNNIFFADCYYPAGGMPNQPWGDEMDHNFVHVPGMTGASPAEGLQKMSCRDKHSMKGDALFMDPGKGDFRVRKDSPALKTGFRNFPMDRFGVRAPRLKSMVRTPDIPEIKVVSAAQDVPVSVTLQNVKAVVRDIRGMGDRSAYGLPDEKGVLILELSEASPWYKAGLRPDDVIIGAGKRKVGNVEGLRKAVASGMAATLTTRRAQKDTVYSLK